MLNLQCKNIWEVIFMKKILKSFLCTIIISAAMLQNCSAFFVGSDNYTQEEYAAAGITWTHYTMFPDTYYFNGHSIDQATAQRIVRFYNEHPDTVTSRPNDVIKLLTTALGVTESNTYTREEYEAAGITWTHHTMIPDTYYFNGYKIHYELANHITNFYNKHRDIPRDLYIEIIDFATDEYANGYGDGYENGYDAGERSLSQRQHH